MVAMGDVSATETAIVYGLEPVWGAAFAWFLLGERWDNAAWIGAALVLCKLVFLISVLCLCCCTTLIRKLVFNVCLKTDHSEPEDLNKYIFKLTEC